MEIIEYEEPDSWEAKGMDWNVPDPRNADYVMAIRNALMERCAAAHIYLPSAVARISPWKPVTIQHLGEVVKGISTIATSFFNKNYSQYKEDWSDFPRMWNYRDLVLEEGCRLYEFAKPGELCENGGAWLRWMKNAIDKLTVVKCPYAWGRRYSRSGSRHDPPFSESIGDAMDMAFDPEQGFSDDAFSGIHSDIYSWSGNTHWKCPNPNLGDDENNVDGYCGYAQSVSYKITSVRSYLAEREFDFLTYALVKKPETPGPYSVELSTSIFDSGESRFVEGMNMKSTHVKNPSEMEFDYGNVDSIPKNEVVPVSDFDEEGNATHRRSAKRGYEGKMWWFHDYGCEKGFKFRSKEA